MRHLKKLALYIVLFPVMLFMAIQLLTAKHEMPEDDE